MNAPLRDGFFFDAGGARLYGFMHPAQGPARPLACVLVHPFMEERQDAHAVLRSLAVALAARGYPTLRFDLFGCGDSEGDWQGASLTRWRDDVAAAVALARREAPGADVALLGLRFGATLAGLAADAAGAARVGLVQPVVRGADYADELLLAHLAAEMVLHRKAGTTREALLARLAAGETVNLFGYRLTGALDRELRAVDLARDMAGGAARALVVDVARSATARESAEIKSLAAALGDRAAVRRVVEPTTLYAEGKRQVTRADEVTREILAWMES
ncbi:MAG: alpha/beta hydrolase [Polyangiales bacterium]